MISFFQALFTNPFLQMALLAAFAASITSGLIGCYVVIKRIIFISGSIAHSVLGGMGLFLWLQRTYHLPWLSPLHGALIAAIVSALLIGWIHLRFREREDTVIAALWSTGMSIGVVFIALTPGYNVELMHFLFGNILWTNHSDLVTLFILDALVIGLIALFYPYFLAICFDEQQARLRGLSTEFFYLFLLCLIAISVVILIEVVGAILVIALLAIPAAIASTFTHHLPRMMVLSVFLGWLFSFLGISVSYQLDWPPGATIALFAAAFYLLSLLKKRAA
jgi:zinc transport system permease protein